MLCPVCSLMFSVTPDTPFVTLRGKEHRVCSSECARKLRSNPPRYGIASQDPKGARGGRR